MGGPPEIDGVLDETSRSCPKSFSTADLPVHGIHCPQRVAQEPSQKKSNEINWADVVNHDGVFIAIKIGKWSSWNFPCQTPATDEPGCVSCVVVAFAWQALVAYQAPSFPVHRLQSRRWSLGKWTSTPKLRLPKTEELEDGIIDWYLTEVPLLGNMRKWNKWAQTPSAMISAYSSARYTSSRSGPGIAVVELPTPNQKLMVPYLEA